MISPADFTDNADFGSVKLVKPAGILLYVGV